MYTHPDLVQDRHDDLIRVTGTSAPGPLARAAAATLLALAALIAGRAALLAIPAGLALWTVIGFAVTIAGATLGHHAHLIELRIAIIAAVLTGRPPGSALL